MRVEFLSPLDVRKVGGREWRLLAPLEVSIDGTRHAVPAGFVTDFASVPRAPLAFLLAGDTGHRAATLHDWIYSGGFPFTRARADGIFAAALAAEGVGGFARALMWAGVRVGGGGRFRESAGRP